MNTPELRLLTKTSLAICTCALAAFFCGCASVTHSAITNEEDNNKHTTGIRYYDSSPYILMQHDPADKSRKKWTSQILYLPDTTKKRQAKITCILAINTSGLTFTNAILTESSVSTDSSTVPVAVIQTLASTLGEAVKIATFTEGLPIHPKVEKPREPDVELFKIVFDKTQNLWGVVGAYAAAPTTPAPVPAPDHGPKNNR